MFTSFFAKPRNRKVGFTLIELLVVIAIIGVLASIVLASLNTARRKSRDARRISDIKQIQLALELFFDSQTVPAYPVAGTVCDATTAYGLQALSAGNFIPSIPRDPSGTAPTNCYRYATPSTGALVTYHLGTTLEDIGNPALNSDKDCNSLITTAGACGTVVYTSGFDGTTAVPLLYDVVP